MIINLHCNCCDCHVIWTHKSDILKHIQRVKHGKAKKRQLTNESVLGSTVRVTVTLAKALRIRSRALIAVIGPHMRY